MLELSVHIRDFGPDHPDFDVTPSDGYGHCMGNIAPRLDAGGKPVFTGEGYRVSREWRDADNDQICWTLYDAALGDKEGSRGRADTGAITSSESFAEWYRNVPGVNVSMTYTFPATRHPDGTYAYETNDFYPIDGMLKGNGPDSHNFHFTLEMVGFFTHDASADHTFSFKGDDDLWVFIDDQLVIDLGGIAGSAEQHVELNRLGLVDGETYTLRFFMAERHQPQSSFRLVTTVPLVTPKLPTVACAYD
ncbi:MAG: fibro-slime domain-containing protein [Planctomycetota bacterium]